MNDIRRLLLNRIEDDLNRLEKTGVGHIDCLYSDGVIYKIDGKQFRIEVEEVENN